MRLKLLLVLLLAACWSVHAQTRIRRPCPASTTPATVDLERDGDIAVRPCSGRSTVFTGSISGAVTGTGTANYVPRFSSSEALTNTPLSWDGTTYLFSNSALNATFGITLVPSATSTGSLILGNTGVNTTNIRLTESTQNISLYATGGSTGLSIDGDNTFAGTGLVQVSALNGGIWFVTPRLLFLRTVTAAGTTGAQTINQPYGSVNFAAGSTSLVVTNSIAAANSLIFLTPQAADATCRAFAVTRAAGSFTITADAACTAETAIAFFVSN